MPVFEREGYAADWTKNYQPATGSTHAPLLCDRIHMLHSIFSVGDFAIYIGGLACLARVVRMIAH